MSLISGLHRVAFGNMIENTEMDLLNPNQPENELVKTIMKHTSFIFQAEVLCNIANTIVKTNKQKYHQNQTKKLTTSPLGFFFLLQNLCCLFPMAGHLFLKYSLRFGWGFFFEKLTEV